MSTNAKMSEPQNLKRQWLDRSQKGRNETGVWWRRHDEYEALPQKRRLVSPRGGGARVNARHCCQIKTRAGDNARGPASRLRRGGEIAGWIVPTATLALLPKCPVCVAAYVAL